MNDLKNKIILIVLNKSDRQAMGHCECRKRGCQTLKIGIKELFFVVISLLALVACSHSQLQGCGAVSEFTLGYQDALYGLPKSYEQRDPACMKANQKMDLAKYDLGYRAGLKKFCRTDYGYEFGRQGQVYRGICSKEVEEKFLAGYFVGRRQFLNEEIKDRKDLIESIDNDLKFRRQRLSQLKTKGRQFMWAELNKLKARKESVTSELTKLTEELSRLEK